MIGSTISHYRIVDKLGEGGMGVVYRARDANLGRFVALKVLPADRVADPERKRRFVQEAKSASALNHPNIVAIYEIGSDSGVDFIAMEYVPGHTLGQMIGSKSLTLHDALRYAIQIAEGLAAAHAAGIIHRDIKPGNIIVNQKGLAKILDFGLAKLTGRIQADEFAETQLMQPNLSAHTAEGMMVGTLAYMSPEQAEGKTVDSRSDIFAFGSLLYEMLTGRRAFQREGKIATLSAILNEEPPPIHEAGKASAALEQIVFRCVRKDPSRRYQHMDDLKVALEELLDESEQAVKTRTSGGPRKHRSPAIWIAALLATACSIALAVWFAVSRSSPLDAELKSVPFTSEPGYEENASVSPDGNQVAYSWNGPKQDNFDIYISLIGVQSRLRLTADPARDSSPAWSPDGRSVAFFRELPQGRAALILIPPLGGPERRLTECYLPSLPYMNPSPAWSPDGKWLVIADKDSASGPYALTLVSASTGDKQRLTSPPPKAIGDSDPAVSSDGRAVAFVRTHSFLSSDLYLLALSTDLKPMRDPARLTSDSRVTAHPTWTPDDREVIYSSGNPGLSSLWRIAPSSPAAPRRLAYAGDEAVAPSLSRQGRRLVYSHSIFDPNVWRLPLDGPEGKAGPPESLVSSTRIEAHPAYSPDGKRIAFESCRSGNYEIWVCDRDGSNAIPLTSFGAPIVALPRWSPDGERLAFDSNAAGQYDVYVINANGGQPRRMTDDPADDQAPNWSNDGKWIYFASHRSGEPQIWKMPATGGAPVQVTKGGGHFPAEAPDGKFLYYAKRGGLWKSPVAGGEESPVLDSILAQSFAVTAQGAYFIKGPPANAYIYFLRFSTGAVSTVFSIPKPTFFGLSVSPDGRSILYTQVDHAGSDLMLVERFR